MKKLYFKKAISLLLSFVLLITSISVSFYAFAVDDYTTGYDLQVYYYNTDNELVEVTDQVQVMEQEDVQLYACLVYDDGTVWNINNSGMPSGMDGYTVNWSSDARYLAFCEDNDGNVHGYDATKGEAIRNWLDNEVGTIPVVGSTLEATLLALFDNDVTDIDDLDTEDVIEIVNGALESLNLTDYEEQLDASIEEYLNKFDVGITATLLDADGNTVDSDTVRVLVLKSDKALSDVIPNAAFIKNYDNIPTTVAVGYEMDLEGIITPVRTHYNCEWTVTGQYGIAGSDLATVDENGHFTAIGEGTVQVKVSPDVNGMTENINTALQAMAKAGEFVDSETIAKAILVILGVDSSSDNYSTLVTLVTKIVDSGVVDENGNVTFDTEQISTLANFILYVIYQDAITIKIVAPDEIPITSYELNGTYEVTEGETSTLKFENVKPDGAVAHDYKISIENEDYAVLTDDLTFMGIDGSTWNNNYITSNNTNLTCVMDGITVTNQIKVYGKDNKKVVYIKINCDEYLEIDTPTSVNATTYPKRLDATLSYGWEYADGSYTFATADAPAYTEDGLAYVTSDGIMYSTGCTIDNLVVQEANGAIQKKQIMSGIQTTGVAFTKKHFWTKCDAGTISTGIRGSVCEVSANILPADASFNTLTFTSADTESVILSSTPLTTTQYASYALTEERRASHATATAVCDENGNAVIYAYAVGNDSCYADISVSTQTGGFTDKATVAFANVSVIDVAITSDKDADEEVLIADKSYQVTAGDELQFSAVVSMSATGSWKNQGFEDVDWSVSDENLASIAQNGYFKAIDVGTVTVTAVSIFGEMEDTVTIKILPDYRALKAAMADCDYDNLDSYDWSYDSWDKFDAYYQQAVSKLADNSFTSQKEVDDLTQNIIDSFNGLVRYLPLEGLDISCSDDADNNGFATVAVSALSNYTNYSTTIVPTVYPAEAEDYSIAYTSSNPSQITVSADGVCKPVSSSTAAWSLITVTVTDPKNGNQFSKQIYVSFAKYQVTSVSVSPTSIDFVGIGEDAITSSATITPTYNTSSSLASASIKQGYFTSSNTDIATVDSSGVVTPVGLGTCTITFTAYDGGYTATTTVKVTTNKNKLKSAIDKANALVEEFYTEDSYASVQTALVSANTVYDDENATQAQANAATDELNTALNALVRNPYANVYLNAGTGGSIRYNETLYTGTDNKVRVLIDDGLSVTAVADEGYHFVAWKDANGNVISTDESATFTIDYSAQFYAEFEEVHAVTGIKAYIDGNDTEYYSVNVGALYNYTRYSAKLSYDLYPSNANFYKITYATDSTTVTISDDGTVTPASNSACYAVIDVTVTNTITGESFKDTITVAFAKYQVTSVTSSPSKIVFNGVNASSQNLTITYNTSNDSTASVKNGFYVTSDSTIAEVDANGVVMPRGIGTCTVTFTSYDGGYKTSSTVKVYADKSALASAINSVDNIIQRNFTEDSYNNVLTARDSAVIVNDKEYATQQEVDLATATLQEAINNLIKLDLVDYEVTVDGNGTVTLGDDSLTSSGAFTVKVGDSVTLVATPDDDNEFVGWYDVNGNQISTSNSYTTTIDGYNQITAKFNKLIYVQGVTLTADGNNTKYYQVKVSNLSNYTNHSVTLGANINPSNPTHYSVSYYLDSDCSNLSINSNVVTPSDNSMAYGTVWVVVTDNSTGKQYKDSIVLCFSKVQVVSVSPSSNNITFNGTNASSQLVTITYGSSSSVSNASVRRGYATINDSSVATVSTEVVDGVGTCMRVNPVSIGSTTATFTAYDGGYSTTVNIKVYADKTALKSIIDSANALNENDYTEDSYSSLPDVLDYAQGVYDTEFASQSDVDNATNALTSAINALVLKDIVTIKVSSIGNGTANINGNADTSIKLERGEQVTVNAVADDGYEIDAWYDEDGNKVSTDTNYTFSAESEHTYIAKFKAIIYVDRIVATANDDESDFCSQTVTALSAVKYTNQSVNVGVNIYPSNAEDYSVSYSLGTNNNMTLSGTTVKPTSNATAYAQVIVTVVDNKSGKTYTDDVYVSFTKNQVSSVSVSPSSITFASSADSAKTITPSYTLAHTSTSSLTYGSGIKAGFFVSSDTDVATVSASGVVQPVGYGSCTITFYSYDAGRTAKTNVTVNGTVSFSGTVVAMASPNEDTGTMPVNNATITIDNTTYQTVDGAFSIDGLQPNTDYTVTVTSPNAVERTFTVNMSKNIKNVAVPIIAVDYVNDGYINAKDYAALKRSKANNDILQMYKKFVSTAKYISAFYNDLTF